MKKIFNARFIPLVCMLFLVALITSCEKEETAGTGIVQLLSFGPTGAKHGDTLRFFGSNLNGVTAIQFTGSNASVDKSAFIQQTNELILLIVPTQAEKGFVTLKTPGGDIVSKTQFNLNVSSTIKTMTLQARPGENITLTGDYLNWVTQVTFNRDKIVTTFVSQSLNQLVVKVPDDAQTGPLVLFYSGTAPLSTQTTDTLKVTLPVAVSFSNNPIKHAENVTITGTDLDLAKQVIFNGVATPVTTFVSQSATQLVVKVPGGAQTGKVTLVAASAVPSVSSTDLTMQLPAITGMTPNPVDPGANLTITGTDLNLVTSVTFQNAPAVTSFVSQTATQIVVKVPTGVARGNITLGVLNSTRTVLSATILEITGAAPPPVIALPIYNDAVTSNWTSTGWIGGGWGGTSDRNNTSPVREGTKSVAINYTGGYGSPLQLGGASVNVSSYTTFKISIYGGTGSAGKRVNIGINGADKYTITVEAGKWTDYAIPISSLTTSSTITEILVKEYSGTGGFTIYVDALGFN